MSSLPDLFHNRWAAPVLAELERRRGARFVELVHALGVGRESLRRTLAALTRAGLVARNPGYGHPLRPEYLPTTAAGRRCGELLAALAKLGALDVGLRKWSMPVVAALAERSLRFSELRAALPGASARALALALKDLEAGGLVSRTVTDDYPPASVYRLAPRARPLLAPLLALGREHDLGA